jgi:hypothetical protein
MTLRDKLILAAIAVVLLLAAAVALAGPTENDVAVTADGGVQITTKLGSPVGPSVIEVVADGSASVKLMWFQEACTDRVSGQIVASVTVQLRDYSGVRYLYHPSGCDSLYIDLDTATEVIVSR